MNVEDLNIIIDLYVLQANQRFVINGDFSGTEDLSAAWGYHHSKEYSYSLLGGGGGGKKIPTGKYSPPDKNKAQLLSPPGTWSQGHFPTRTTPHQDHYIQ